MSRKPGLEHSFVYGLCDPRTQELRYVGITNRVVDRHREHIRQAERGNTHLDRWIKQLLDAGLSPERFIIEEIDESGRVESECFWIAYFKSIGCRLTNITSGGEGLIGFSHSEESKKKMSESAKRKPPMTDETRKLIADGSRGHKLSDEARLKISIAALGNKRGKGVRHVVSEETREKLRISHLGQKPSEENIRRTIESHLGKKLSEETKRKIGESNKKSAALKKALYLDRLTAVATPGETC